MRAIIIALEREKGEGTDYLSIRVRASFVRFARHFGARLVRYARALLVCSVGAFHPSARAPPLPPLDISYFPMDSRLS